MTDKKTEIFLGLISQFSMAAFVGMGKIPDPLTGKIQKNLEGAKSAIDILEVLEEKTKGNLSEKEEKFLKDTLTSLRLTYVEELESSKKTKERSADKVEENKKNDKKE